MWTILALGIAALVFLLGVFYYYYSKKPLPAVYASHEFFTPSYDPNIHIHYKVHGHGPKKVLFIVGLATNYIYWLPQIEYMNSAEAQEEYTICVFDNRGSGKSSTPIGLFIPITTMARDAIELVQFLGWSKVHIVGQSMGGLIAQCASMMLTCKKHTYPFMANCNVKLESLTLVNTFPHVFCFEGVPQKSCISFILKSALAFNAHDLVHQVLNQMFTEEWLSSAHPEDEMQTYRDTWHEKLKTHMFTEQEHCKFGTTKQILGILSYRGGKPEDYKKLSEQVPILLIGCPSDKMVHADGTRRLYELFKPAAASTSAVSASASAAVVAEDNKNETLRLEWMNGGHIISIEKHEQFNNLIYKDWIPKHSSS